RHCGSSVSPLVPKEGAHHAAGALACRAMTVTLYPATFRLAGRAIAVLADLAGPVEQTSAAPNLAIAAVEAAAVQIVATVCAVHRRPSVLPLARGSQLFLGRVLAGFIDGQPVVDFS